MLCYLIDDDPISRLIFEKLLAKLADHSGVVIDKTFEDQTPHPQLSNNPVSSTPGSQSPFDQADASASGFGSAKVSPSAFGPSQLNRQQRIALKTFASAIDALACIRKLIFNADYAALPDVIFLDIVQPGLSGWEFLNKVNALLRSLEGDTPIESKLTTYLLTSFVSEFDLRRAGQYTLVRDCLLKPITVADLQSILGNVLQ